MHVAARDFGRQHSRLMPCSHPQRKLRPDGFPNNGTTLSVSCGSCGAGKQMTYPNSKSVGLWLPVYVWPPSFNRIKRSAQVTYILLSVLLVSLFPSPRPVRFLCSDEQRPFDGVCRCRIFRQLTSGGSDPPSSYALQLRFRRCGL